MQLSFQKATATGCILGIASVLLGSVLASTGFGQAGGGAGGGSGAGGTGASAGAGSAAPGGVGAGAGGTGTGASGSAGLSSSPTAAGDQPQLNQPQNRNATDQPQVGASQGTFQSGQVGSTVNPNVNQLDAQRQQLDRQRQTLMQDQTQLNANQRRAMGRGVTGALDQAEPANQANRGTNRFNTPQGLGRRGTYGGQAGAGMYGARGSYGARGYANQPQYNTGYRVTDQQAMGGRQAVLGIDLDGRYPHAAVVGRVQPGGGAGMAGLMPGDTIWSVNNLPINSAQDLMAAISRLQPGESISVGFTRPSNVQIRLGARPAQGATLPAVTPISPPATEGTLGAPPFAPPADADQVRPTSGALNAGPAPARTTAGIPGQGVDADAISTGPTPGIDTDVNAGGSTTTP